MNPLKSELSASELMEFAAELAALYGEKARFTIMASSDRSQIVGHVWPISTSVSARFVRAPDYVSLLTAVEADARDYAQSHRAMTAGDIGVDF